MAYKDKDRQREANKQASQRRRDRKGMTQSMTNQGMTVTGSDTRVIPKQGVTEAERDKSIEFMAKTAGEAERASPKRGEMLVGDLPPKEQSMVVKALSPPKPKRGKDIKPKPEHTAQGNIRVSKPVIDERPNEPSNVIPSCDTLDDVIGVLIPAGKPPELIRQPKRGKDIKTFADLPPDVQRSIDRWSMVDGRIDKFFKANRTAIAVNYQHLSPDRYNSTGVA